MQLCFPILLQRIRCLHKVLLTWWIWYLCLFLNLHRRSGIRWVAQAETHPVVLLTMVVSQSVWSNGWWWITTPSSCVHVTQTAQRSEQVHMAFDPLLKVFWGGGRAGEAEWSQTQSITFSHTSSVRVPCDTPLTWFCTPESVSQGACKHLNLSCTKFIRYMYRDEQYFKLHTAALYISLLHYILLYITVLQEEARI